MNLALGIFLHWLGGIASGLTRRYLGIALGMAVALGFCAAIDTLMPPVFEGTFASPPRTSTAKPVATWTNLSPSLTRALSRTAPCEWM